MAFKQELEALINRCSLESESNTPDFILAGFLTSCLMAWDEATNARENWYGRPTGPGSFATMLGVSEGHELIDDVSEEKP